MTDSLKYHLRMVCSVCFVPDKAPIAIDRRTSPRRYTTGARRWHSFLTGRSVKEPDFATAPYTSIAMVGKDGRCQYCAADHRTPRLRRGEK